ncbi:YitT family protein [Aminicella lysinilytica]|uniref:Uncharacterized membrane-anchored protein YitT (DUF2179 family) n=1 Tax=Aminicella lysinilytica TaxID=433323 RepID=A0A4R6PYE6_9FIRM|nr:YitT family protein [Aminicella lysinilytica]NLD10710.1 YitT family protein [Clostridiales bacterium]TDP47392.1 uncharacterized membrane-anchored protein YitT (DUF2179 family) [Aminicella lysinilytica]
MKKDEKGRAEGKNSGRRGRKKDKTGEARITAGAAKEVRGDSRVKKEVKCFIFCTVGALIIAFNLKSFVNTGGLFPGGFSGATLLIIRACEKFFGFTLPYSAIYIPMNLIPIYIGIRYLGKRFTIYSMYVIILSSVMTDMLPKVTITYDILLICLFGGIINGAAISLCLYVGASGGGTDFISIYLSEKKGIDAWNYILMSNVCILAIAGIMFGWDKALYSIVYQFCSTQVIQTLFQRYNKHTLMIISDMPEAVYDKISIMTHHDATLFKGESYYEDGAVRNLIYSVVSSEEVDPVVKAIKDVDPHAFINVMKTEQLNGRFYKKPKD